MAGYLLDNNHVGAYFNQVPSVISKLGSLPNNTQIRICAITLGEIEAGHEMNPSTDESRREECYRFIIENFMPHAINVSKQTRIYYGKILGRIWAKYPPKDKNVSTEAHLVSLGVDVNDVWSVAVAWEHGFTFVTHDKMQCIRDVVGPKEVPFDCWY